MTSSANLSTLLTRFFTQRLVQQRHASPHTIRSYRDTFHLLLLFAKSKLGKEPSQLTVDQIDAPLVSSFLDELQSERGTGARSRNLRLTAIRSFFRFAAFELPEQSEAIQRILAIPCKRYAHEQIHYLTRAEVDALLMAPDRTTWSGRRDQAWLLLAVQTGLRLSELTGLTRADVQFGAGAHVHVIGKGRKERCTPMTKQTAAVMQAWLKEPTHGDGQIVFPNRQGGRMSSDGIQYLLAKHVRTATRQCPSLESKKVSPHVLRHTSAMELLQSGVGVTVIALWAGHSGRDHCAASREGRAVTEPDEVVPVRITVQLAGVGDVLAVEAAAMSQLERLEAQLGLPIAPEIVVAHTGDDERLTIGEERIALSSPDGPPEDAASRLRLALHRHRELLVTGAVAEAVARAWELPADGVVGGAQRFRAMLQEAVRRGLALRRLREAMSGLASPLSTETWLEAALAGLESPLVRLRLAPSLHATVSDAERVAYRPLPGEARDFNGLLRLMQDGLFYELGVPLRVAAEADPELPDGRFAVAWNDIASPPLRGLDSGCFLVNDTTTRLALLDIRAVSVTNPANGQLAAVAEGGAEAQRCAEAAGLTCWNPLDYVVLAAIAEIRRDIGALLTTRMTEYLLAKLGWASPDLVRAATERFDLVVLTRALRALIDEEITIRDLRTVLETLLSIEGTTTADPGVRILFGPRTGILMPVRDGRPAEALYPEELAECARAGLRRYLTRKYTRGANILPVHLMDHGIEALVAANDGELPEPDRWAIATAVRAECAPQSEAAGHAVILTALYVRRGLRAILRHNLPRVAVLSYAELFSPGLNIYPISRISLS